MNFDLAGLRVFVRKSRQIVTEHKGKGVVPGGAGGAMAPPDFGRSVTLSQSGGQIMPT